MANEVSISIRADLGDLKRGLNDLKAVVREVGGDFRDTFGGLQTSFAQFGLMVQGVREALSLIASPVVGISETAASFEALQARLESLYGSAYEGAKAWNVLVDVAATTPFDVAGVVNAGTLLKAFGLEAKTTIKQVADLAAFMGETIPIAASALGRAFAGGVGASEILRERGVLALVKSFSGIEDLTKLTLPEFRKVLLETLEDPAARIAGSTDRLSRTFTGTVSNMKDSLESLKAELGQGFNEALKPVLKTITELANSARENVGGLVTAFKLLAVAATTAAAGIIAFKLSALGVDGVLIGLMLAVSGLKAAFVGLGVFLSANPFTLLIAGAAAAASAILLFGRSNTEAKPATDAHTKSLEAEADALRTVNEEREKGLFGEAGKKYLAEKAALQKAADDYAKSLEGLTLAEARAKLANTDALGAGKAAETILAQQLALSQYIKKLEDTQQARRALTKEELSAMQELQRARDADAWSDFEAEQARYEELLKLGQKFTADRLKQNAELSSAQADQETRDALARHERLKAEYQQLLATVGTYVQTFADGIGEALYGAWTNGTAGLKEALKEMLLTILSAVEQLVLQAKIAALAKALVAGGFNIAAGLTALSQALPAIVGLEALFAGARLGISRFEHGGVIDRPTMALMGEAVHRSGPEIVAPRTGFRRELRAWADEVLLPVVQGSGSGLADEDRGLLREIRDALNPSRFGSAAGRSIGRELALAGRGRL